MTTLQYRFNNLQFSGLIPQFLYISTIRVDLYCPATTLAPGAGTTYQITSSTLSSNTVFYDLYAMGSLNILKAQVSDPISYLSGGYAYGTAGLGVWQYTDYVDEYVTSEQFLSNNQLTFRIYIENVNTGFHTITTAAQTISYFVVQYNLPI